MAKFILGLFIGLVLVPVGVYCYFRYGNPPVAVSDQPFPFEKQIVHVPLNARIHKEMPARAPIQPTPENLLAGAHIYRVQCAACHGLQNQPSAFAKYMYPPAPQLWSRHRNGVVGVSDDPVGETYWKVENGIRLTGMPAFSKVLNQTQMWQVSLLLKNADKPLPPEVQQQMQQPMEAVSPQENAAH